MRNKAPDYDEADLAYGEKEIVRLNRPLTDIDVRSDMGLYRAAQVKAIALPLTSAFNRSIRQRAIEGNLTPAQARAVLNNWRQELSC